LNVHIREGIGAVGQAASLMRLHRFSSVVERMAMVTFQDMEQLKMVPPSNQPTGTLRMELLHKALGAMLLLLEPPRTPPEIVPMDMQLLAERV
jgi:hypothetical protein